MALEARLAVESVNPKERAVALQRDSLAKHERVPAGSGAVPIAVVGVELRSEDHETLALNFSKIEAARLKLSLRHRHSRCLESWDFPRQLVPERNGRKRDE